MSFCSSTMGGAGKTVQSSASVQLILIFMLVSPCLGAARLVGGSRGSEGRLEVTYNGQWGTVCDDNFDVNDAKTACRSLGYTGSVPIVRPSAYYGQGSGPIWLDELRCRGSESDVLQCPHSGVGIHNCAHYEDVGVDCRPPTQIRLVGGGRPSAGRVEVNIGGRWGTVCDDAFDTNDGKVVCRMLGYTGSAPTVQDRAYYGEGSDPIWLDDLGCAGTETDILRCPSTTEVGHHNCAHSEDVGVDCLPSLRSGVIRLSGRSRKSEGRVEVSRFPPSWGTVCDDSFDVADARVVCRMLGYTSEPSPTVRGSAFYGEGTGTILLDDVECQGHESSIFSCRHVGSDKENCNHNEDVGVDCRPPRGPSRVSISGPVYHITDGTKPLTLTCTAEDFTASVSFRWTGTSNCTSTIISAEYNTCTFTPSVTANGNTVTCHATNTEKTTLTASDSYTINLKYPPRSSPIISGFAVGDSVVEGSNLTLTCSISGGTPHVTEVSIVCEGQGRTLTSPAHYTVSGTTVSNSIDINLLRMEDDGMKCNCSGNWTTQPNLYSRQESVTIRVVTALAPSITSLTLNGEHQSVAVNESDHISVTLSCAASGRPKPSIRVVRVDTGQPLEVDTSHTSGQDENVQQYTLTTSARCQDAAIYRCGASNRAGVDEADILLHVNCAPRLQDLSIQPGPDDVLEITTAENETKSTSLSIVAYPQPTLTTVVFLGADSPGRNRSVMGQRPGVLTAECRPTLELYVFSCVFTALRPAPSDGGFYNLTLENPYGEITQMVKLIIMPEEDASDVDQSSSIVGAAVGGGVAAALVVAAVVGIFIYRKCLGNDRYARPQPRQEEPNYTDLVLYEDVGNTQQQTVNDITDPHSASPYVNQGADVDNDATERSMDYYNTKSAESVGGTLYDRLEATPQESSNYTGLILNKDGNEHGEHDYQNTSFPSTGKEISRF